MSHCVGTPPSGAMTKLPPLDVSAFVDAGPLLLLVLLPLVPSATGDAHASSSSTTEAGDRILCDHYHAARVSQSTLAARCRTTPPCTLGTRRSGSSPRTPSWHM